jgi:peptidoglycan/LPS O-acetylase OafA/YrhL
VAQALCRSLVTVTNLSLSPALGKTGGRELVEQDTFSERDRFLVSGDEAGTAPGDRPFRPDVEGLRAVAVLAVVLYHAGLPGASGGYIGVDVFFVISGFVITGLLLRERSSSGRTSILAFYGRRCRRIIPAATLVIVVSVVFSYVLLGVGPGQQAASDGRWASVFLANFHFISTGTNYLNATQLPSPLQNFWSLAVEEQFYVVYPTLFLLIASLRTRFSLRARLAVALSVVIAASYSLSVLQTSSNPVVAYFSPFTRAWELALGALVAVSTQWLLKLPAKVAALATWSGLGAIVISALVFTSKTNYPGSLVAIPVVGTAFLIGGGVRAPRFGVEMLIGLRPFRWLGRLSYSLYLWHWPVLALAAQSVGRASLSVPTNTGLVVLSLALAFLSYVAVENPIRHARFVTRRRLASVGLGVTMIAATLAAITLSSGVAIGSGNVVGQATESGSSLALPEGSGASLAMVLRSVAASEKVRNLLATLDPPLSEALNTGTSDIGLPSAKTGCWPALTQSRVPTCVFGDPRGTRTMVLYGDSHAAMWFQTLDDIAIRAHWRLVVLTKGACPAAPLSTVSTVPLGRGGDWVACDKWHRYAIARVNRIDPDLLIVSQLFYYPKPSGSRYSPAEWEKAMKQLLRRVKATAKIVIGNNPLSPNLSPLCLSQHAHDVQACTVLLSRTEEFRFNDVERRAAVAEGAHFIDVLPWFCTRTCSSVIGNYEVYVDNNHVSVNYSLFLRGVLANALGI